MRRDGLGPAGVGESRTHRGKKGGQIGDRDPVGVFEAHTLKRMPDSVPNLQQAVLANCGHWIQNEQGPKVNELLLGFLGRT